MERAQPPSMKQRFSTERACGLFIVVTLRERAGANALSTSTWALNLSAIYVASSFLSFFFIIGFFADGRLYFVLVRYHFWVGKSGSGSYLLPFGLFFPSNGFHI